MGLVGLVLETQAKLLGCPTGANVPEKREYGVRSEFTGPITGSQ